MRVLIFFLVEKRDLPLEMTIPFVFFLRAAARRIFVKNIPKGMQIGSSSLDLTQAILRIAFLTIFEIA